MLMVRSSSRILLLCGFCFILGITFSTLNHGVGFKSLISKKRQEKMLSPSSIRNSAGEQTGLPELTGPRKILVDCGGNMASTVRLFRETYPDGKDFIIHSFEIDGRLAPYFSPYSNHFLHCPVGVSEKDGNMTAFTESAWSPNKGKNNGKDMQWGGGTLFVDKKEVADKLTGGRRKLSHRKIIPVVDISKWIQENTKKEDYVIFKLDVEGAEFLILEKMVEDGTFEWIDKYYGEYHTGQPVGLSKTKMKKIIEDVKKAKKLYDWGAERRNYVDFDAMHQIQIPSTTPGIAGAVYAKCLQPNRLSLVIDIGMSKKEALRVMSTLASYSVPIPVTVFVYSDFAEEWPDIVKFWATKYEVGLRGNHPFPPGHFKNMSSNWIREAVISSEMRLFELGITPVFYSPFEYGERVDAVLKKRTFRIIRPAVNFPPKSEPTLTVENYYRYRDVERIPKALRMISNKLRPIEGGILSLDTDVPDTHMNLVFLLDYLVENSGYTLVSLNNCLANE